MKTTENQNKSKRSYAGLIGITAGLIAIAVIYVFAFGFLYNVLYIDDPERAGQFGDMFGSVNSLFSALAFLVISISLYLQNRELKLQRKQLELQMDEAKEARTGNLKAQEAQRKEMELTRQLHAKSNFESKLMFLLQNLERQIDLSHGKFATVAGILIDFEGSEYFDRLYQELTALNKVKPMSDGTVTDVEDTYTKVLFNHYGLFGNTGHWAVIHIEKPEEYNNTLIKLFHDKRKTEYYNSWITYRTIIGALREEYKIWSMANLDSQSEIDRNFTSYAQLITSAIPFTARIYYLYLNLLGGKDSCKDFIYKQIYREVESADLFHALHQEILFKND